MRAWAACLLVVVASSASAQAIAPNDPRSFIRIPAGYLANCDPLATPPCTAFFVVLGRSTFSGTHGIVAYMPHYFPVLEGDCLVMPNVAFASRTRIMVLVGDWSVVGADVDLYGTISPGAKVPLVTPDKSICSNRCVNC